MTGATVFFHRVCQLNRRERGTLTLWGVARFTSEEAILKGAISPREYACLSVSDLASCDAEAEALVAKYRSTSQKRTYWIEADEGQTPHRPPQERPPLENPMGASNPFGAMLFDAKKGPPRKI